MKLGLYHLMLITFIGEHKHNKLLLTAVWTLKRERANIFICTENPEKSECKVYQIVRSNVLFFSEAEAQMLFYTILTLLRPHHNE